MALAPQRSKVPSFPVTLTPNLATAFIALSAVCCFTKALSFLAKGTQAQSVAKSEKAKSLFVKVFIVLLPVFVLVKTT